MKIAHKISALTLALGLATTALAASGPESVGDVTLFGNITSYAPSWVWSVYDYPGGGTINLNPADAKTADGMDTYKFNSETYIAAEGSISALTNSEVASANFGYTDSITLSTNGRDVIFDESQPSKMVIPAFVTTTTGVVEGTMALSAFSGRAVAEAYYNLAETPTSQGTIYTTRGMTTSNYQNGSSCFSQANASLSGIDNIGNPLEGTSAYPLYLHSMLPWEQPLWDRVAELLQAGVNTPQGVPTGFDVDGTWSWDISSLDSCTIPTVSVARLDAMNSGSAVSVTAANVLTLLPDHLTVPTGTTGTWNATLTVTAAQI